MGSLGSKERFNTYFERYESMKIMNTEATPPFHFGSHYSTPAVVN